MAFETLSDRLRLVADASLALCRTNYGSSGLKREEPIHASIGWKPTFYLRPSRILVVAVEVNDYLFPQILQIAADEIAHHNQPVAVYQARSLDIYQKDRNLVRSTLLRDRGFGIITVSESGAAQFQRRATPLGQCIPLSLLDPELQALTPRLKVCFRTAHATYETDIGQGLQAVGQIIEALIKGMAAQAGASTVVPPNTATKTTADVIDILYASPAFRNHRAALGGARNFVGNYRNAASHPAATPQQAAEKIRICKAGFLEALRIARELRIVFQSMGYKIVVH